MSAAQRQFLYVVLLAVLAAANGIVPGALAEAGSKGWVAGQNVSARLISGLNATGNAKTLPLGLELRLKPGWKTYWRTPGDAGLPPILDWHGSTNLKSATLSYPAPERFELFDLQTFGYGGHLVLPIAATLENAGEPASLRAKADLLVCEKICVPETLKLELELPAGSATLSPDAQRIDQFRSRVPASGPSFGLDVRTVGFAKQPDGAHLTVTAESQTPFEAPDALVESDPFLALSAPDVTLSPDARSATLQFSVPADQLSNAPVAGRDVTVTLIDGERAIEKSLQITQDTPSNPGAWAAEIAAIMAVALLGGLILNLMPCVLPVLSIKLMAALEHVETPPARVRASFLATAAGIVASLLALAGILIALKATGQMVGWGIQFQQPVFIGLLTLIIALFAYNLAGFFQFELPAAISNFADRSSLAQPGFLRDFATGAFATLLATPCSAPFVGTAVGFALGHGAPITLLIFTSLGVGLALPYLAVAAFPTIARSLPRPGPWMEKLRLVLTAALALTALWLLSVLAGQIGFIWAIMFAAILAVIGVVLHAPAGLRAVTQHIARAYAVAGLALLALGITAMAERATIGPAGTAAADAVSWQRFERNEIRKLVSQGRVVFVDVTADWCITCKTNKRLVIDTKPVMERLRDDVVPMRADWTSPDPKISEFLGSFGRYGIPLNAVFGPGRPSGILLPELLTQDAVLAALNDASARGSSRNSPRTTN